jgi:hypothetical protein
MGKYYSEKDKIYHKNKYYTDPEYRKKSIDRGVEYYKKNRERLRLKRIQDKENGVTIKRSYVKVPIRVEFLNKQDYQQLVVDYVLSGATEKIVDIFFKDTITFNEVFRFLPSHRLDDKEALHKEYKELKSNFSEEKLVLVIIKP